jgi:hypothetical protein
VIQQLTIITPSYCTHHHLLLLLLNLLNLILLLLLLLLFLFLFLLLLQLKTCPQLLAYSLEHRIKPRHRLLHGKGLKLGLHSMLSPTDLAFYQRYGGGLSRVATLQSEKPTTEPAARWWWWWRRRRRRRRGFISRCQSVPPGRTRARARRPATLACEGAHGAPACRHAALAWRASCARWKRPLSRHCMHTKHKPGGSCGRVRLMRAPTCGRRVASRAAACLSGRVASLTGDPRNVCSAPVYYWHQSSDNGGSTTLVRKKTATRKKSVQSVQQSGSLGGRPATKKKTPAAGAKMKQKAAPRPASKRPAENKAGGGGAPATAMA